MVICLSTTVRNDTLQDAKEHRVSLKCRKQLRVEELEMVGVRRALEQIAESLLLALFVKSCVIFLHTLRKVLSLHEMHFLQLWQS